MAVPLLVPAAIAGISALYKVGSGLSQEADAKKRALRNKRPFMDIQQEYFDNQGIAENQAGQGFTSKTVENYNTQNERGLQSSIDATLQGGGGPNSVQTALATYDLGNRNFAAADAEKQTDNIKALYERNKDLAGQKVQQWVVNKYKPFMDEAAAIAQEKAAGRQNVATGISEGVATASSLYTAGVNADLLKTAGSTAGAGAVSGTLGGGEHVDYFAALKRAVPSASMESDYTTWLQEQDAKGGSALASGELTGLSAEDIETLKTILSKRGI